MGGILGALTGGLLGGSKKAAPPIIQQPAPREQRGTTDPNRSKGVAEARRRRLALSKRTGRSALRIDLANGGSESGSRTGINIT